jgi:hypothetical protein
MTKNEVALDEVACYKSTYRRFPICAGPIAPSHRVVMKNDIQGPGSCCVISASPRKD